ncbi:MAG: hypothetical protein ACFN38_06820 [Campylobacter sp.]
MSVKNLLVNLPAFLRCGFWLNPVKFMVTSMREQNLSNLSSNSDASEIHAKACKIKRGFRIFSYNLKS